VDDERTAARVAVISYPFWMRRFGGDASIVGRAVTINNLPFTIVGVTPAYFFGVEPGRIPDVWVRCSTSLSISPGAFDRPARHC
jgi:hypothetical protein